jgi:hypothetical protein
MKHKRYVSTLLLLEVWRISRKSKTLCSNFLKCLSFFFFFFFTFMKCQFVFIAECVQYIPFIVSLSVPFILLNLVNLYLMSLCSFFHFLYSVTCSQYQCCHPPTLLDSLTLWSWDPLEKPPVAQLLKNFPAFMKPKVSLPCWWQEPSTDPYPETDQSSPDQPILSLLRSVFILYSHLRPGLLSGVLPTGFATKNCMHFSSPQACYISCPSHPSWLDRSNYIWRTVRVTNLLIMHSSPASYYFISLRFKCELLDSLQKTIIPSSVDWVGKLVFFCVGTIRRISLSSDYFYSASSVVQGVEFLIF